ncbi:MAG: ATP-dependent helicase [Candidatus Saccharimonadales bacterium]
MAAATPGAGKTRLLTYKIAHLLSLNVHPSEILALTFTNKAAKEMKHRAAMLHPLASSVWIGTFHSWCLQYLRNTGNKFTICDDKTREVLISEILEERGKDKIDYYLKMVDLISNYHIIPENIKTQIEPDVSDIRDTYRSKLRDMCVFDFNELLNSAYDHIKQHGITLPYKYVLVDEWQDTNQLQYEIIKLMTSAKITVTGDDDQSIYSWRGACYANTELFISELKPQVFIIPGNYRSVAEITTVCNRLIKYNQNRLPKEIIPFRKQTGEIVKWKFETGAQEALAIAQDLKQKRPKSAAILYRISSLSMDLEHALALYKISYEVADGWSFFDRVEVRSLMSLMHYIVNPNTELELLYFAKNAKIGLTSKRLKQLANDGIKAKAYLLQAQGKPTDHWMTKAAHLFNLIGNADHSNKNIAHYMLHETGFRNILQELDRTDRRDRTENADRFCNLIEDTITATKSLNSAMDYIMLSAKQPEEKDQHSIKLMTIHAAKGLEFGTVYVVGMEDGIMPHTRTKDIEEERRLAYVAMSRAADRLILSSCKSRKIYKKTTLQDSQFLQEALNENH